jgi:hypothetical protein
MIKRWPIPGSLSLPCAMDLRNEEWLHICAGENCACACHLDNARLQGLVRLKREQLYTRSVKNG